MAQEEYITREKLQQMLAENKNITFYLDSAMQVAQRYADNQYVLYPNESEGFTDGMLRECFYDARRGAYIRGWKEAIEWLEIMLMAR